MYKKGQGTIEYLVIIAIVVVIALVTVGILLQLMGQGAGINSTSSKIAWSSAEPWAITDWSLTSGNALIVTLQNNSGDTLGLNTVAAGDGTSTVNEDVSAGATKTITIASVISGVDNGEKYVISKDTIVIDFNSSTISNKTQYGVADLVGNKS